MSPAGAIFRRFKTIKREKRQERYALAQLVGAFDRLLLLVSRKAREEDVHLRIAQAGAAGEHVPCAGLHLVRLGADAVQIKLGEAVLGGDVAAFGLELALRAENGGRLPEPAKGVI